MSIVLKRKATKSRKAEVKITFPNGSYVEFWAYKNEVLFQIDGSGEPFRMSKNHFRVLSDFCEKEFEGRL